MDSWYDKLSVFLSIIAAVFVFCYPIYIALKHRNLIKSRKEEDKK